MSRGACPDCGSEFYRDGRCLVCPTVKMLDQHRQMAQRSGPEYEKAVTRGRAGAAAWRAAGSQARVKYVNSGSIDGDGNYRAAHIWCLAAPLKRGEIIEATPEQVDAWYAWRNSRS
jgi:hypothetical protein